MSLRTRNRLLAAGLAVAALAGTGLGAAAQVPAPDADGTNVLLLGRDTRKGLSQAERKRLHAGGPGCDCSDVIMLMHLSEDGRWAGVVSIPRGVYIPKLGRQINAAHAKGGPDLAERTVEKLTDVPVDKVFTVKLAGFEQAVNDLGHVNVCTRTPLRDVKYSGLDLDAGTHHLHGRHALRYARARHGLRHGDITRVRHQQRLVADIAGHIITTGDLKHPERLRPLVGKLAKSFRSAKGNSAKDLFELGWKARDLRLDRIEFATPAITDLGKMVPGAGSTVVLDKRRAQRLFATMREDKPLHTAETRFGTTPLAKETRPVLGSDFGCE